MHDSLPTPSDERTALQAGRPADDTGGNGLPETDGYAPAAAGSEAEGKPGGKLSIAHWDEADRPREKLAALGASALSNAELLAILIGSGTVRESAVDLTRRILADCKGSLHALGKLTLDELCAYNGIGAAKGITILAACELGRRRAAEPAEERPRMDNSRKAYDHFRPALQDLPTEEIHVMLLNRQLRLIGTRCVGRGGLSETVADVRCIVREAIVARATAIILCHNHPSGNCRPSSNDDNLTRKVKQAAELLQITLADHIIVADERYYSYADEGRL